MPGIVNMIKKILWLGIPQAPRENVLLMFCQTDVVKLPPKHACVYP